MADEAQEEVKRGPGIMGLVKALALISVLVVVEVVAAGLLIPSAHDTERLAHDLAAAERGQELEYENDADTKGTERELEDTIEVEIGAFSVTRYNPEADKTMNIDFELFATVLVEEEEDFRERFEGNRNRVKEQVVLTLHGAQTTDLTSPELGLIKRRILEKTNHALGRPLVRQVLLTRFNFVER
ncbi:MAG: hypothetical protein AAGG46_09710 [Planctomycetota bacterium]